MIDVAAKVFYERGYASASVQEIADELGILKGSVYHYIKTKEDLLYRVLEEVHDESDAILAEVSKRDDLPPLDRLQLYVMREVEFNARNVERIAIYYTDLDKLNDERRSKVLKRRKAHERFVTDVIKEAQASGDADPSFNPAVLGNLVFGSIIWVYHWYQPKGRISPVELSEVTARYILNGVVGKIPPSDLTAA